MKTCWYIKKAKKYNCILKVAILNLKSGFLFIVLSNFYPIIKINYLIKRIQWFINRREKILMVELVGFYY